MRWRLALVLALVAVAACAQPEAADVIEQPPGPLTSPLPTTTEPTVLPTSTATELPTVSPSPTSFPATATTKPTDVRPTARPAPPTVTPAPPSPEPASLVYVFPVDAERCTPSSSHHDYPASDITCPFGTPFVAVTSGVVDFVSREDLYAQGSQAPADRGGLSVAIIGDDGVRYYGSHLSEVADGIEPGVRVEAGQLLGLTGASGNAAGTAPHVHFGISRPTTPEDWEVRRGEVWPQTYLAAWRRGEQVTPELP